MHFTLNINFNAATYTFRNTRQRGLSRHILNVLQAQDPTDTFTNESAPILPNTFYKVAFMPSRESFNDMSTVQIPGLNATLYPFQRRAVQWLLMREQVAYSGIGPGGELQLEAYPQPSTPSLPFSFDALDDVNGRQFYVSDLYHIVTRDIAPFREIENGMRGGILAEEMGLGKTVEIISLILTHKRGLFPPTETDAHTSRVIHPTGATLIVTPDTLQNQWLSEFKKHAPHLLVMKYPGMKAWATDKTLNKENHGESLVDRFISKLTNCDVVVTTYAVLQTELHYAIAPPERSMRYEKKHERQTSPLVQIGWWRVCLDEAQQIDSGVSSAAKVACLIPRVHAWAVTGTPIKEDPSDLWGLLLFLRYEPFASHPFIWKALLNTHKTLFNALFNKIAIRHSKQEVRDELKLPPQKRYVMTMPFTAIERHHYQSQFTALIAKAGLSEQGTPLRENWDPDDPFVIDYMKKALANLRQTILHPELGSSIAKVVTHRTLAEHLESMIEHSEASIKTHQRNYWIAKLSRGQLLENSPRVKEALQIWEEVLQEVEPNVLESREELQRALDNARQNSNEEESLDEEVLETPQVGRCRRKLRSFLDIQHRAAFFIASAFFQIKSNPTLTKPDSDEFKRLEQLEVDGYETARKIRREILQEPLNKASEIMKKLQERAEAQSFVEIPEIITSDLHGIETGQITEDLKIFSASLNEQADIIDEWREHVIQLLLKPLVDSEGDEEITGEEYEDSTKVQDHLMVYTLALGAVIGDRQEALTGWVNERIRHETTTAEGMAKEGEGHAPEKLLELLRVRSDVKPQPDGNSLRGIIGKLREISSRLRHDVSAGSNRARLELQIVTTQIKETQDIITEQNKIAIKLERDLDFFTSAMNARVEFYRQLQSVSDNVAPLDPETSDVPKAPWLHLQEDTHQRRMAHWQANRRHLIFMREDDPSSSGPCPICQDDDFAVGAITTCGHSFCKECIVLWVRSKHTCPLCKQHQSLSTLSEFDNRKQAVPKERTPGSASLHRRGRPQGGRVLYSDIQGNKKRAIQDVKIDGPSYSTKIDTLVKHLLWLREEDPGAKSVIFTQFRSFVEMLEHALAESRIGFATFTRMGNKSLEIQRFKDEPGIECLLMDAKAHSSGLNLVNANHVFLCEPLLNAALELQAIARVDRIGQKHETTVWLYLIEDTVEEHIQALSEQRRFAHMEEDGGKGKGKGKPNDVSTEEGLEAANSRELEQSNISKLMDKGEEGEVVDKGDLWECLFGRPFSG
ncbi:SNF2 family N-terminal domain-containing protein [Xylaria palmicola]|nr:SNF2 family N-terminal domain-containing protein [Xylaria palmicola]